MTLREFYLERLRAERPAFLNVLRAIPAARADYKPHERSPAADQLVWTLAGELKACLDAANKNEAEWQPRPAMSLEEMIANYEQWSKELEDCVTAMNDAAWNRMAKFIYNGRVVAEYSVSEFLWFILFDAIHHRGQLSAYLAGC